MCFSFSGWWLFRLILFLLVLLVLLAEASNGHQPRYKYKCFKSSSRVVVLWVYLWTMLYTSETWFIVYNCNKMEFAACSLYGIWLCRHNGKSMRVKKNHSGANLTHNHKLFYGDMLSFIQVATPMITPSHHFLFKHFSLLVFNLFYFILFLLLQQPLFTVCEFVSFRHQDNRFQLLCKVAFALSTSTVSVQDWRRTKTAGAHLNVASDMSES